MRCSQSVDARWRHGAEWTVRVRYQQLNDDKDHVQPRRWTELFVSSEATSTIVDSLALDRQYLIIVDAKNEVGYNSSLTLEPIVISDAETSKLSKFSSQESRSERVYESKARIFCNTTKFLCYFIVVVLWLYCTCADRLRLTS